MYQPHIITDSKQPVLLGLFSPSDGESVQFGIRRKGNENEKECGWTKSLILILGVDNGGSLLRVADRFIEKNTDFVPTLLGSNTHTLTPPREEHF